MDLTPSILNDLAEARIEGWKKSPPEPQAWRFESVNPGRKYRVLDLRTCALEKVPESIRALRDVEILDLGGNWLTSFPAWISELSALVAIDLSESRISELPAEIGNLPRLRFLYLQGNCLHSLPNTLRTLPLTHLDVRRNPLDIPQSVLEEPTSAIVRYYFGAKEGPSRPLLELKLLLVGRGRSGKTTLSKQLAGESPSEGEEETHSISIRDLTLNCELGNVRTRAWDFGGQEILHATHQFFLSERSLYLLVLEPRSGMALRDAEYWLKIIESQGRGSPAIVVMNWSRDRPWRIDEVKLKRKFPFVIGFVSVDAMHGDGIDVLRRMMAKTVHEKMPDVWVPFPGQWREIKDAVAGMKENFLTYQDYSSLCAQLGEADPAAQSDLAGILHALGLALYFGKDPRLHDTRVLNPSWVTGGVYAVIRAPSVAANNGQLSIADMDQVLNDAEARNAIKSVDYPKTSHGFILELMRAFQLCYASEDEDGRPTRYLVPELLPEFEPELHTPTDKPPVHLRYRYDILPPGLLPRFIVRTHALSEGGPHWRHGVVLNHAGATALIRAETDQPELHVFAYGSIEETRLMLVSMVQRELFLLHGELRIQPSLELDLGGQGEAWIGVKALRDFEQPEITKQKLPIQPEGTAEIDVTRELNKLSSAEARAIDRDPTTAPTPIRLFVSYAHDDERQLKRLDLMLEVVEDNHSLTSWTDKRLIAGDGWDTEIRRRLEEMDIFLFIASQSSLVRPYIKDPELRRARERHQAGEIEIVTVKLEPCAVDEDTLLGKLQRLGTRFKSIAEAPIRSLAWEEVRKDLLPVISRIREKRSQMDLSSKSNNEANNTK